MAKERTFSIVINGLKESIDAVDSLNRHLDGLERRLNDLQGKTINISGGGVSLPKASELSEIEKIEKEIAKVQEKQAAHQSEEYKALLMEKEALKQIESQAKASAKAMAGATNPNEIDLNTMAGMKQRMRDLKLQHNNTDINSDLFKEQTREINELNQKLKELEQEYGVYSRNVGNYANGVAEGYKSAKAELKALKTEMQNLTVKQDRGIISEEEAERLKSLIPTVKQLESSIQDAGKPMDALMDTMQSILAIASTAKGIASFFGLDGNKVEESLKKLMALQNALQGLQTIKKQIDAGDGLGKYFASMNSAIDTGTKKLLVYNRAILGTGKAAKIAAVGVKTLGTALKTIGIGLVIAGIVQLLDLLDKWLHKGKEVTATMQAINDIVGQTGQGYAKANINIKMAQKAIDNFNGSAKEEKKLLDQLNSSTGGLVANCKNLDEAKQKIVEHADEYIEMMRLEAQAQALLSLYTSEYAKLIQTQQIFGQQFSGNTFLNDSFDNVMQRKFDQLDNFLEKATELQNRASDLRNSLFTDENENINKNNDKALDAEKNAQELTLRLMREGLRKKLIELDNEKRRVLETVKGTAQEKLDIEKKYNELSLREVRNYVDSVKAEYSNLRRDIENEVRDLEIAASENNIENIRYIIDSSQYKDSYVKLESRDLLKYRDTLTKDADDLYKQLEELQFIHYNLLVKNQITYYNELLRLQKEAALKRKLAEETEAREELEVWEDEQKKKIEDLKENIAALESLGTSANTAQKLELEKSRNELESIESSYENLREQKVTNFWERIRQIQQKYETEVKNLELNSKKDISKITADFYEDEIQKFNDFAQIISDEVSRQPTYIKGLDIINLSKTRENFKKVGQLINVAIENVEKDIRELDETYHSKENIGNAILSEEDYSVTMSRLLDMRKSFEQELDALTTKMKDLGGQWWGTINNWLQQLGQATSSILSSLSEITSNGYEKQIDEQQAFIDKYEELLQKQEAITQKHADRVNSIEDELANARSDRRQYLVDQLNAEIQAQRESLKEEEKARKKKEAAEHKQADLEYKQALARKRMDEAQAKINAAMAISMAAVNHWPIPAIPLMALATAVGAAQVAAVKSQYIPKPKYADGGVIQGKSHKQGGVKVLGGTAEVEGGEFITNKITTTKNVELLEYINSNKKRIDLSDMIEFFNDKPRATIKSIRSKFENGGVLTSPNVDISGSLDRNIIIKDDSVYQVSVVDINRQQDNLKNIQVLAGL